MDKDINAYFAFKELRKRIKIQIDSCTKNGSLTLNQIYLQGNPKNFWRYVKLNRITSELPLHMTFNGSQTYRCEQILNCFADYFQSVYNNPVSNNNNTSLASAGQTVNVNITDITEEEILDPLKALDSKSTNGPDRIPSLFLKDFAQEFSLPLFYIFNLALKSGTFPDSWKIAKIIIVFKKGDRGAIENYRPVALLNYFEDF
jgi:hypothetical protein